MNSRAGWTLLDRQPPKMVVEYKRRAKGLHDWKSFTQRWKATVGSVRIARKEAVAITISEAKARTELPNDVPPYWAALEKTTHPDFTLEWCSDAIRQALENEDRGFFIGLARRLETQPSTDHVKPHHHWLIDNWTCLQNVQPKPPGLCFFTGDAIADLYAATHREQGWDAKAWANSIDRLGLKKPRFILVRRIVKDTGKTSIHFTFPSDDRSTIITL